MSTVASAPPAPSRRLRYLALVSGQSRGVTASLLRGGFWLASLPYGLAVSLRNFLYNNGWLRSERVSIPVVSVGNLTVGGTGKTPCVEHVAHVYRERDLLVALLSRGYGAHAGPNDEALVLEENLPDVPHLQGPDRVALARAAIEELESEILVLDDGFQHRRLARDLDIVLIDSTQPWGYGHLLPRGLLREPVSSLRRAQAVVLTRCDQVSEERLLEIRQRIQRIAPALVIAETAHKPVELVNNARERLPLAELADREVAAFCGLGNPGAFRQTLSDLGARIIDFRTYPDHHPYSADDIAQIRAWGRTLPEGALLLTSQKDLVKLRSEQAGGPPLLQLGGKPLWAVRIRLAFRAGREALENLLLQLAPT